MFADIVVPIDQSDRSAVAARVAAKAASQLGARVHLVALPVFADRESALTHLSAEAERLDAAEVNVVVETVTDDIPAQLSRIAASVGAEVMCMATRGRGRSASVFGSVATGVVRQFEGPVVLVGPACEPDRFDAEADILTLVDGSAYSESILPVVDSYAAGVDASVTFASVVDASSAMAGQLAGSDSDEPAMEAVYLNEVARRAKWIGRATTLLLHGNSPAPTVVEHLHREPFGLVAMATHGAGGLRRALVGSVAFDVVRQSPVPVVSIRP